MTRSRQRGQSVIEFGIIAILFTLIMFAIADFGLLLNDWLSVSSGVRLLARDAAVGVVQADLVQEANTLKIPGVSADKFPGGYCCGPNAALVLNVTYFDQCMPGVGLSCNPVSPGSLDKRYTSNGVPGTCTAPCAHPAPPKAGACPPSLTCPGDTVVLTLTAAGAQVITPLVRPFFQSAVCTTSTAQCYVALGSTLTMRFEGDTL